MGRTISRLSIYQLLISTALYGAKYLEALSEQNLVKLTPSNLLNQMYAAGLKHPTRAASRGATLPTVEQSKKLADGFRAGSEDKLLLRSWNGKLLAEKFGLPGMELEIERAVEQVEKGLASDTEPGVSTGSHEKKA